MITNSYFLGPYFFFLRRFYFFLKVLSHPSSSSNLIISPNASWADLIASSLTSPSSLSLYIASGLLNPRINVFAFFGE